MKDAAPFSSSAHLVFSTGGPGVLFALALRVSAVTGSRLSFVGPITASALLQAAGIVDDHVAGCSVRDAVKGDRAEAAARRA